jgi:hypothetical protein
MDGNQAFSLEDGGMRMDAFAAMQGVAVSHCMACGPESRAARGAAAPALEAFRGNTGLSSRLSVMRS